MRVGGMPGNFRSRGGSLAGVTAVVLIAAAAVPALSGAASVDRPGDVVQFVAGAGEDNNLVISRDGANYVFTDAAGVTIMPTAPCVAGGPTNVALCPVDGTERITANLGNLDDDGRYDGSVVETVELESVSLTGGAGSDALTASPGVRTGLTGDGGAPAGNDTLTGSADEDDLAGNDGNDILLGNGEDDELNGGAGEDVSDGGAGFDFFDLNSSGPDGADVFIGGGQIDELDLRGRDDDLRVTTDGIPDDGAGCPGGGCEGDNVHADVEQIDLGDGNDIAVGGPAYNDFSGSNGNDQLSGGGGYDELNGAAGDDVLRGGPGLDELGPDAGADQAFGDGGDDYIEDSFIDSEVDVLSGGAGIDSLGGPIVTPAPLRISLDNRANDGFASPIVSAPSDNVRGDIENLSGSDQPDVLIGNGRANELDGLGGGDRLVGKAGGDSLTGDDGADRLLPGKGRDTVDGGGGADRVSARDRRPDEILCGAAVDRVKGDRSDRIGADCDRVARR